jgi:hypothetical protein
MFSALRLLALRALVFSSFLLFAWWSLLLFGVYLFFCFLALRIDIFFNCRRIFNSLG